MGIKKGLGFWVGTEILHDFSIPEYHKSQGIMCLESCGLGNIRRPRVKMS